MKIIQEANRSAREHAKRQSAIIKRDGKRVAEAAKALKKAGINIVNASVDGYSYNLYITGSRADLDIMFGVLRRAGLSPSTRPQERETNYSTWWSFPESERESIWITFTSTSCKRVQVRTELQEVPVYETVCEE